MRRVLLTAVGLLSVGVLTVYVTGAAAKTVFTCQAGTPAAGVINGDVAAGPGCVVAEGTIVNGSVRVIPGGSLEIRPITVDVRITGDVESKKATAIDVQGTFDARIRVDHNVKLEETSGMTTFNLAVVGGDIDVKKSNGYVQVGGDVVNGNVKVHDNRGNVSDFGFVDVSQNTVHGNVEVNKNDLTGTDNIVQVSNGPEQLPGSLIDGNLTVADNSLTGSSFNLVQVDANLVDGNADVHGNDIVGTGSTSSHRLGTT